MLFALAPLILIPIAKYGVTALVSAGMGWWLAHHPWGGGSGSDGTNDVSVVTTAPTNEVCHEFAQTCTCTVRRIGFDYYADSVRIGEFEKLKKMLQSKGTNVMYDVSQLSDLSESLEKVSAEIQKVGAKIYSQK